jgi:hypothetical protein
LALLRPTHRDCPSAFLAIVSPVPLASGPS